MLVIPAIDLKDGQAVRLFKGDYNQKTVYSDHPEELAQTPERPSGGPHQRRQVRQSGHLLCAGWRLHAVFAGVRRRKDDPR